MCYRHIVVVSAWRPASHAELLLVHKNEQELCM